MSNQPNLSCSEARRAFGRYALAACLIACSWASGPLPAQQSTNGAPRPPDAALPQANSNNARESATQPKQPAVTDPHQAQIIADSQKLVNLSQELKTEVAKSSKDTLSLTVIKKAEEVERLAKTLKDELSKSH